MPLNNLAFNNRLRLPSRRITGYVGINTSTQRVLDKRLTHSGSMLSSLIDIQSECASSTFLPLRIAFRQEIELALPMEDIELAFFTGHSYGKGSPINFPIRVIKPTHSSAQ